MTQPVEVIFPPNTYINLADLAADNSFTGTNKFGSATDYTQFDTSGRRTMVGNARTKKELRIDANVVTKGASAPTSTATVMGASGGVLCPVLQFSKTVQQDVYFSVHPDYDMDDSVNVSFHIMWKPGSSWTAGNYMWKLEYLIKYESPIYGDADHTTGTPTTISMDVTPTNAKDGIETEFTDTINLNTHQLMCCHFYRDVANDNADDTGDVKFFEIEYTKNSDGEAM